MVWFIYIGHRYKDFILNLRYEIIASVFYLITSMFCYYYLHDIPAFESGFHVTIMTYPLFISMAVSGTMMLTMIARIVNNKLFQYLGMMSIVIFCVHFDFLKILISKYGYMLHNLDNFKTAICFIIIFLLTSVFSWFIAKLLDNKYGKYLIGKY